MSRAAAIATAASLALLTPLAAQEAKPQPPAAANIKADSHPLRPMFDALVQTIENRFVSTKRLADIGWRARAEAAWPDIAQSANATDAAPKINALLAELKTSHTQVFTPDEPEYYIIADVFGHTDAIAEIWAGPVMMPTIGMFTAKIEGRDHVTHILEGSPADDAGLKVGDEIVSVDGAPYKPVASFRGKVGSTAAIQVRKTKDGAPQTLSVPVVLMHPAAAFERATSNSARVIEKNGKRIGYIHLWHMRNDDTVANALARIDAARAAADRNPRNRGGGANNAPTSTRLEYSRATHSADANAVLDAVIIDNRVKIGGQANAGRAYIDTLTSPRGGAAEFTSRTATRMPEAPATRSFSGRSAMLIDNGTRSAAEMFAFYYRHEKLGPLFGATTAGAVTAASARLLPGGLILTVGVSDITLEGQRLEGVGVKPDIDVARPLPYSNGADPILDAAIAYLAK